MARPCGAAARHGLIDAVGIDAALEKAFHLRVDARLTEAALEQCDDAEGRQVPLVEHDGIAQRNRPGVVRVGIQQIEQLRASARGCVDTSRRDGSTINGEGGSGRGQGFPFRRFQRFLSFDAATVVFRFPTRAAEPD